MTIELQEEIHRMHANLCSALADPTRILILYTLMQGESNVSDLAEAVGIPQPSVSRHLKVLRESGLANSQRDGHSMVYELADTRVIEALNLLRSVLASNLEKQVAVAHSASQAYSPSKN